VGCAQAEPAEIKAIVASTRADIVVQKRRRACLESGFGTSRHFVAMRNLVATGGIADIGQARTNRVRFMSTRPSHLERKFVTLY
jgi:hypothetical protein